MTGAESAQHAEVRKTIWFVWLQGLDKAPNVVRECYASWVERNPGWDVIALDEATLADHASVSYSAGSLQGLSRNHRSDLLRLDLLAHHGGVWADSTLFCVQPLDDWLLPMMGSGVFAFSRPGPDRLISSWLLASDSNNLLMNRWFDLMLAYFRGTTPRQDRELLRKVLTRVLKVSAPGRGLWFTPAIRRSLAVVPYYALHYGFEKLIREDSECGEIWERTPKVSADGPHRLYRAGLLNPLTPALRSEIDGGQCPVYKMSWRVTADPPETDSVLGYLLATRGTPAS